VLGENNWLGQDTGGKRFNGKEVCGKAVGAHPKMPRKLRKRRAFYRTLKKGNDHLFYRDGSIAGCRKPCKEPGPV
jgi:hypothetical protein